MGPFEDSRQHHLSEGGILNASGGVLEGRSSRHKLVDLLVILRARHSPRLPLASQPPLAATNGSHAAEGLVHSQHARIIT
jgi:hypothetical protein